MTTWMELDVSTGDDSDIPAIVAARKHAATIKDDEKRLTFYLAMIACGVTGVINTIGKDAAWQLVMTFARAVISFCNPDDPTKDDCTCPTCQERRRLMREFN